MPRIVFDTFWNGEEKIRSKWLSFEKITSQCSTRNRLKSWIMLGLAYETVLPAISQAGGLLAEEIRADCLNTGTLCLAYGSMQFTLRQSLDL